jgi:hypothetical protein
MAKKELVVKEPASLTEIVNEESLVVEPNTSLVFRTNFPELEAKLSKALAKYKGIKVTDSNFEQFKLIKKECSSLRILLENRKKEAVKAYIELPKDRLVAEFATFQSLIAEVEGSLDAQFDVYEEERKGALRAVLSGYVQEAVEKYGLRDEFSQKIELKKSYFNKTAKESETRADIMNQALSLKKEQDTLDESAKMIISYCEREPLLNSSFWVNQLQYRSLASILSDIETEISRLRVKKQEVDEKKNTEQEVIKSNQNDAQTDEEYEDEENEDEDGSVVIATVEMTYPVELGSVIATFFKQQNIKAKILDKRYRR